ncbi:hypothetical protein ZIOFF_005189 [Zingiber officinale]|uniref:Translation elongation factor EF1B beta/delta subunit guanine nucleotide exchange domain-containing protein n=1 Tax=Zingiber officinale TaxID=94328 RepID=A0A8J5HQQ0_ZINOF|nr:hypothetical protein ZIOFF_005189 [Zingiber officinale]
MSGSHNTTNKKPGFRCGCSSASAVEMAISFTDLHTETGLTTLEEFLSGKTFISGDQISKDDVKVFAAVAKPGDGFPNVSRWYSSVSVVLSPRFPGEALGVKIGSQAAVSAAAPSADVSKEAADGDDDDLDLFGDETEEDKKAAEEREVAVKASSKKKESGKSSVLLDVKPWDDETDMKKLEEAVRSVEMPGLLWGACKHHCSLFFWLIIILIKYYFHITPSPSLPIDPMALLTAKLVAVGYGIKKLQIMMTIVDDLVSVDSLIEETLTQEPHNEYIQSCDIVAFNKI